MKPEKFHSNGLSYKCHKSVSELSKQEMGLYCSSCSENIIDFRNKTKSEYEKIVAENKSGCGVFYDYQINDEYEIAVDLKKPIFIFSFLSALLFSRTAFSQDSSATKTEYVQLENQSDSTLEQSKIDPVKTKKEIRIINRKYKRQIIGRRTLFVSRRFPFIHYKRRVSQSVGFW